MTPMQYFPRLSTSLFYERPGDAIEWLCTVFGFTVRLKVGEGNDVHHSELMWGDDALIMVSAPKGRDWAASPNKSGFNSQAICLYVDDVEAHFLRASRGGAEIVSVPKSNDYGPGYWEDRSYEAVDCGGHHWWFCQRIKNNPA